MKKYAAFVTALCLGLLLTGQVAAQDKRQVAKRFFDKAVASLEKNNYREALDLFEKAYTTSPHWMVLAHIGTCQAKLGEPAKAIAALERYLSEGGGLIPSEERQRATDLLESQRQKVGVLHLIVSPKGSEALIDGESVGKAPFAPILLRSGSHKISVILENKTEERSVNITAGQEQTVRIPSEQIIIRPVAPVTPPPATIDYNKTAPPTASSEELEAEPRWSKEDRVEQTENQGAKQEMPNGPSAPFYAMIGLMAAGVVTGGVGWGFFGYYYASEQNYHNELDRALQRPPYSDAIDSGRTFTWKDTCNSGHATGDTVPVNDPLDEYYCNTEKSRRDYAKGVNTAMIPAIVGTGVTVLAAGMAILFYFNPQWFDKKDANSPQVSLLPIATGSHAGLLLTGSF